MGKCRRRKVFGVKEASFLCLLIVGLGFAVFYTCGCLRDEGLGWIREYEIGAPGIKGEVNRSDFPEDPAYDIGANQYGYAVFKDPEAALARAKLDFSSTINEVGERFGFSGLSQDNYEYYKNYAWQITVNDTEKRKEAQELTKFLDIYENSLKR